MTDSTQHQFQIHLPGLLKVLAENLYSTKKVAIRELLQNAHDSCIRRQVESEGESFRPRVDIWLDAERRTLTISDNGSGLTREEIADYLSTIGRSYTRELGDKLSFLSPEEAASLIGQFGLGFLSAFLLASEVVLITRSAKGEGESLRWHSTGDVNYDVSPAVRAEVGTTVELHIKPAASFILNPDVLTETIQQYADFLPLPIHVDGSPLPVNLMTPPWESSSRDSNITDYIARAFKMDMPLCVISLHDQEIDVGHDTLVVPLKGFLFVPTSSVASVREYGDLNVYIRRMFICEHHDHLLPRWARFVRGVIDCPYLQPTASREDIQQDDTFVSVQQALETQLINALRHIAENDPGTWKKIVRGHSDVITGWAVQDNEFFDRVADLVAFRTTRGLLSLPEYLKLTGGSIYYVTREMGSLQEQVLGEGRGVPVVDASWFAVTPFLKKYADLRGDAHLVQMDGDANQLLRPVADTPFAALLTYYRARNVRARVANFKPEDIPALIMYPKDAEFIRETRQALDRDELPGPIAGLVSDFMTRKTATSEDDLNGTLYLNAACPLITKLAEKPGADPALSRALDLLYQIARLFAGRMLTPDEVTKAFRETSKAIEELTSK
ncbi:MAG TPA: ATP-binding protein [Anaerolineales bacterium]|nr:ATP-binding protein [Anaerolineales bacterium]